MNDRLDALNLLACQHSDLKLYVGSAKLYNVFIIKKQMLVGPIKRARRMASSGSERAVTKSSYDIAKKPSIRHAAIVGKMVTKEKGRCLAYRSTET